MRRADFLIGMFVLLAWLDVAGRAQLREIDAARLPQDGATQATYQRLLPFEQYAQSWSAKWNYDVPKADVASVFTLSLKQLTDAAKTSPDNHELQLLAGLVAHFAYNLDVQEDYEPAVDFLLKAGHSAPDDMRAMWFLGIHKCQADEGEEGMQLLLKVEEWIPWEQLPVDYWDDYVTCATVALMPAHGLRAISRAVHLGASAARFQVLSGMNEKRFKPSDPAAVYPAKDAWTADKDKSDVVFTSRLCGVSFAAHESWSTQIPDVTKGTCSVVLGLPEYPDKKGTSSPSLLLMVRPQKPEETLSDFVRSFLHGRYAVATPTTIATCPSTSCMSYEILDKDMYAKQGGAHLLAVAFERDMPEFDGLMFEHPVSMKPNADEKGKVVYFRPDEVFHRLPGKLYYLVILDSNAEIFDPAKKDFDFFLGSIRAE